MTQLDSDIADRLALRALVERYAQAVDSRDLDTVVALFVEDARLLSHLQPGTEVTPLACHGRTELRRALELGLAQYRATTHIIGGQTVDVEGAQGRGETWCMAHHLYDSKERGPRMLVMAIRYEDSYVRRHDSWLFAERRLRLDWREDRPFGGDS